MIELLIIIIPIYLIVISIAYIINKIKYYKTHDKIIKSLSESLEKIRKMNTNYEPNYGEVKDFYKKYVIEEERNNRETWTTEKILSLEEFLDEYVNQSKLYDCNFYGWLVAKTSNGHSFDPKTGTITYF